MPSLDNEDHFRKLKNMMCSACHMDKGESDSLTTYITRPVSQGTVKAVGKVVNETRSQFIAESVLYDEKGEEIAPANGIFVRSKIPLSKEVGYR